MTERKNSIDLNLYSGTLITLILLNIKYVIYIYIHRCTFILYIFSLQT